MAAPAARAIPAAFPEVLRGFAKEVLRKFPRDVVATAGGAGAGAGGSHDAALAAAAASDPERWILEFAVDYFRSGGMTTSPSAERELAAVTRSALGALDAGHIEELATHLRTLFERADRDHNGTLDLREFKSLVHTLGREIGLGASNVRQLMAAADVSQDGRIDYAEFLPVAMDLLQLIASKIRHAVAEDEKRSRAETAAHHALVRGLTPEELGARMLESFRAVDVDSDGYISREEMIAALRGNGLGLSKRDINLLTAEADLDASGKLNFQEFAPLCYALLAESVAKQIEIELTPWEQAAIAQHLVRTCEAYDTTGVGRVTALDLQSALADANLHLSWLQMQAIGAEADVDETGHIDYREFAPVAAGFICALFLVQTDAQSASQVLALRTSATINGLNREQLRDAVAGALAPLDTTGSHRVFATDARTVLKDALHLEDRQVDALISAARAASDDGAGTIDIAVVVDYAFDVLEQQMELNLINSFAMGVAGAAGGGDGGGDGAVGM